MKKLIVIGVSLFLLLGCQRYSDGKPVEEKETEKPKEEQSEDQTEKESKKEETVDNRAEAEANAKENPAAPGKMLYDKSESKFKGMQYHFKGEFIKKMKVEGLAGQMENALLVKNDKGYVMPIFPPYDIEAAEGDEIEAWGPLSGDGYASSDLDVDNVVGVTGAMNASQINVNGEMK